MTTAEARAHLEQIETMQQARRQEAKEPEDVDKILAALADVLRHIGGKKVVK